MDIGVEKVIQTFNSLHLYAQKSKTQGVYRIYSYEPKYDVEKKVFSRTHYCLIAFIHNSSGIGRLEFVPKFLYLHPEFEYIEVYRGEDSSYSFYYADETKNDDTIVREIIRAIEELAKNRLRKRKTLTSLFDSLCYEIASNNMLENTMLKRKSS